MEHTVIHDEKVDRFEVFESGQIAYLQYEEKNGILDILHTVVPPQLEGQGIAQSLTEAAIDYAKEKNLKIRPTCAYAKMFFTRHTQYKEMLVD
ncbi:N-acetyltransferase [Bacteroidaceae bacterium]|jgi:predicted GNAT family acetyltransferase|nr:N-acetyltransferase [Bacteroides sp.]